MGETGNRFEPIKERARGRWRSLLPAIGVHERFLTAKHGPCPICGGTDRFRWDNKDGSGSFYCNQCGAGSGVELVMRLHGVPFMEAKKLIEQHLPETVFTAPQPIRSIGLDKLAAVWKRAHKLDGSDPASRFLASRGLGHDSPSLRWMPKFSYAHDNKSKTEHPVMLAMFVGPDRAAHTIQYTYLDESGRKANVPKPRKLAATVMPAGGAVRLGNSAETMGIAEGVETALAASRLFNLPVWASLTAGALEKWEPPTTARHVIVFGDNDLSATGQAAAWSLAKRLIAKTRTVEVRLPETPGTDWNDVLCASDKGATA